jgi:phenylacetate-CoA ligase
MPVVWSEYLRGMYGLVAGRSTSRDRILAFQNRALRSVVRSAYERVPYYRRLFDRAGLKPEDVRGLDDLPRIPVTSRRDLQELPASDLLACGVSVASLVTHRTSGSSGAPLTIRRERFEEYLLLAYRWRGHVAQGRHPTDREASIGYIHGAGHGRSHPKEVFHERLSRLWKERVDCLLPSKQILGRLRVTQPTALHGTPSVLTWLAEEMTDSDRRLIRPRIISCSQETLSDSARQRISAAFGAEVFNNYGAHEFVGIASECPHRHGYHVSDWTLILEVLRDGRPAEPGEQGEVVGTALHSYAMPFIRYRLGDLVVRGPAPCPCSAPFSTLLSIEGRTLDMIHLPDGRSIHPYAVFGPLVESVPWVRRFQVVQETPDSFRVRIVTRMETGPDALGRMAGAIRGALGTGVQVETEVADRLPAGRSGKFYPYVSFERLNAWKQAGQWSSG